MSSPMLEDIVDRQYSNPIGWLIFLKVRLVHRQIGRAVYLRNVEPRLRSTQIFLILAKITQTEIYSEKADLAAFWKNSKKYGKM